MTSRERMRAILDHKEADKIPIDCGGMHSSAVSAMLYNDLKKHLNITEGDTRIYDVSQQLALPEQWYLDKFQVDVVDLAREFAMDDSDWVDWELPDGSSAKFPAWVKLEKKGKDWVVIDDDGDQLASMVDGAFYFDQDIYPYYQQTKENFDDLETSIKKISWMAMKDPMFKNDYKSDFYESVGKTAKRLYEETDYCITANYSNIVFEPSQWLYRNDELFMKMFMEPNEVKMLFDKMLERHFENLDKYLPQVDGYADVLIMSDDLGMQTAPLISPEMYKELIFPYHKAVFDYVHKNSNLKTFIHSCGAIKTLIPSLIEAGLDILNPVQTQCTDMDPQDLKNEFGKDLVFWGGGVDTQNLLAFGDVPTVRAEVQKNCEIFMKDGGFVFTPIHNMLPGIPPKNIVAMYDVVNSIKY